MTALPRIVRSATPELGDDTLKTIIEPFRIKSVEPIRMTSRDQRAGYLAAADYNLFALASQTIMIDLLTDSGTSSMSANQWAGMMRGDESYAGSPSFDRFEAAVRNLMPFKHVIPTHQGRAAERILFTIAVANGQALSLIHISEPTRPY